MVEKFRGDPTVLGKNVVICKNFYGLSLRLFLGLGVASRIYDLVVCPYSLISAWLFQLGGLLEIDYDAPLQYLSIVLWQMGVVKIIALLWAPTLRGRNFCFLGSKKRGHSDNQLYELRTKIKLGDLQWDICIYIYIYDIYVGVSGDL